ncbi:condensation domain-containing protein [Micromonospora sp. NPDC003241]
MARLTRQAVRIDGERGVLAPATLGQRSIWVDIDRQMPDTSFYNSTVFTPVPEGVDLPGVLAALNALVRRHEALRTLFHRDPDGNLMQQVMAAGELPVEICEATAEDPDPRALVDDLEARVRGHRFDHTTEWPIRPAVGVLDGAPRVVITCVSHAATDYLGTRVIGAELARLLAGEELPPPAMQPVELAEFERSEPGRRVQERSLAYWREQLVTAPSAIFTPREPEDLRYAVATLSSSAVKLALDALATRYATGSSVVLLTATAKVLGRRTGHDRVPMILIAGNRHRPELRGYVGNLVQDVPATIDVSAEDFAELVKSCWGTAMKAYRSGISDRQEISALRGTVAATADPSCYFNDLRQVGPDTGRIEEVTAERLRTAQATSRLTFGPGYEVDELTFFLKVIEDGPDRLELTVRADTTRLGRSDAAEILREIEELLVTVAAQDRVLAATGAP